MANLPTIVDESLPGDNNTPLPLLVAKRWDFPLAYVETEEGTMYAILDWMMGLLGVSAAKASNVLSQIKRKTLISNKTLPYTATDGKTYQRDHADDKGLYLIAQHMRVTKSRPVLDEIKKFLAAAGAFVDLVRREPETVITSGAIDPETAMDAAIAGFRAMGRDDDWIRVRVQSKIKRGQFTAALTTAVAETLNRQHYAIATDDIYRGLWDRTAAHLRRQLDIPKNVSLRDNQPMLALHYQGIAEEISAQKLGDREEISWSEARRIVQDVAEFIGKQAAATSEWLGIDLATGFPLLRKR